MNQNSETNTNPRKLGMVLSGSLTDGIEVRIDPETSVESVKVGTFVTITGQILKFFGVVTDISLDSTDSSIKIAPPDVSNPYISSVISGTTAFGIIKVEPMLILSGDESEISIDGPRPAKTLPSHFSNVSLASDHDIELVFGNENQGKFWIGNPLDMESKLCLDIEKLVRLSNGVFGKSGTGKTFLTRLLLIGILQKGNASNLVFDMHSEYGWQGSSESQKDVKGLKQLFSSKVAVFSLDEDSSRRRGLVPDYVVQIGYEEIEPEDVQMLRETLGLSEVAAEGAYDLQRHFGNKNWLREFLSLPNRQSVMELAENLNINPVALSTLHNRLSRFQRLKFMDEKSGHNSVKQIIQYLDRGMHIVLEFGRYGSNLSAYILVANLLTRRIYQHYVEKTEMAAGDKTQEPRPLVITIEEAHKFLTPSIANQTIFGTIAREMRKYNVTLLIVDQRPSGIDDEVMSQLGTKICYLLDSDKDIDSVLAGLPGSRKHRALLSKLDSRQQALAFGHALPMPVVIETREYGTPQSYKDLGFKDETSQKEQRDRDIQDLFGITEE